MAKLYAIVRNSRRLRSPRTCFATSAASSSTAVTTLQAQFCRSSHFAQILRAQKNGARKASRLPSKDCVGSNAPSQFHSDEIAACLDSPVYQPDATARRRTRRDACPEKSRRCPAHRARNRRGETRSTACLESEKRRDFAARLGRQDKANWRSLAPSGRKGLSAHCFLHLVAPSERRPARCRAAALRNFLFNFNSSSDGFRNVRG
jgi:hypothetical protein